MCGVSSSSFLLLIEEKKQKKIKASGTPAKFSWYFKTSGTLVKLAWYQAKFPAPEGAVRDACQVGLVLQEIGDACQVFLVLQEISDAGQVDYRTILATISLSSVRKAAAS